MAAAGFALLDPLPELEVALVVARGSVGLGRADRAAAGVDLDEIHLVITQELRVDQFVQEAARPPLARASVRRGVHAEGQVQRVHRPADG